MSPPLNHLSDSTCHHTDPLHKAWRPLMLRHLSQQDSSWTWCSDYCCKHKRRNPFCWLCSQSHSAQSIFSTLHCSWCTSPPLASVRLWQDDQLAVWSAGASSCTGPHQVWLSVSSASCYRWRGLTAPQTGYQRRWYMLLKLWLKPNFFFFSWQCWYMALMLAEPATLAQASTDKQSLTSVVDRPLMVASQVLMEVTAFISPPKDTCVM